MYSRSAVAGMYGSSGYPKFLMDSDRCYWWGGKRGEDTLLRKMECSSIQCVVFSAL